jgi:hypothetical protein
MALGVVTVFRLLLFFLFYIALFHGFEFERADGDDFKVGAALGAGDEFTLFDIVFVKIELGIAFRAKHRKTSLAD